MKAIILAAGNQTRFGKTFNEQPKVLYPLSSGETLLSNTIHKLNQSKVEEIVIAIRDKERIAEYVKGIESNKPLIIDRREHKTIGDYFFMPFDYLPATYIFGDIYFPESSLVTYCNKVHDKSVVGYDAIIGVSKYSVGDYRVTVNGDCVTKISKEDGGEYYTCGLFSFLNPEAVSTLERKEKLTDIVSQLCQNGHKLGYVVLEERLVDLDTQDKVVELAGTL